MKDIERRAAAVRLAIFDVDGVLTDGRLYYTDTGSEIKAFHTLDGHGLRMLKASGVALAIISGRSSRAVEARAANLGVAHVYQGIDNKLEAYGALLAQLGLENADAAYMADDIVDLPVLRRCGLSVCVPAAPAIVKQHVHYVTRAEGGIGAVRECCELIMRAQGTLDAQLAAWLE